MRRGWQALLVIALVTTAGAANAASPARVTVTDTSIRPASVKIRVGGKVTWTNSGKQLHVVSSLTATFQAFVLRPGRSKTLTFKVKRCEPYTVDGQRQGRVLVGVNACGAAGQGTIVRRYDVRVTGSFEERREWTSGDPEDLGVQTTTLTWQGTWKLVTLKITSFPGGFGFFVQPRSRITGNVVFSDTRPSSACSGKQNVASGAQLDLYGSRAPAGSATFSLDAKLTSFLQLTLCPTSQFALNNEGTSSVKGLQVRVTDNNMGTWAHRTGRGTFFPLDSILAGKEATIETGNRTKTETLPDGSKTLRWRATVKLTPVR